MFTNRSSIPLSLAVWLASDDYDHSDDPDLISATSLLRPIRELVLARQNKDLMKIGDIEMMIPSRMGTALHTAIEKSWDSGNLFEILESLNFSPDVIKNVEINPKKSDLTEDTIPVYMELRSVKTMGKFKVSGKFDFVSEGVLEDFKSTGTYNYISQSNVEKYAQQGSIYKWLNPDIITADHMFIQYIFTDWSIMKARQDPKYPQKRLVSQKIPLMSTEDTEVFVKNILDKIEALELTPQDALPLCTDSELWRKKDVYKYYKDASKKVRSTKNFDTHSEAATRQQADGMVGVIDHYPGQVVRCKYCNVVEICDQAKQFITAGLLVI